MMDMALSSKLSCLQTGLVVFDICFHAISCRDIVEGCLAVL